MEFPGLGQEAVEDQIIEYEPFTCDCDHSNSLNELNVKVDKLQDTVVKILHVLRNSEAENIQRDKIRAIFPISFGYDLEKFNTDLNDGEYYEIALNFLSKLVISKQSKRSSVCMMLREYMFDE